MAETVTASIEQTLDQELEGLKTSLKSKEMPPAAPPNGAPAEQGSAPLVTSPAAEPALAEDPLEAKLKEITEPEVQAAPKFTAEQEQILRTFPDVQTAQQISSLATGFQNFSAAFEGGKFDSVEQMFENWNKDAYDAFTEYLYNKHVANGSWVDRWISEKEGNPAATQGVRRLEQQISALRSQLEGQNQARATQAQTEANNRVQAAYDGHINSLFDKIEFSPADRRWVMADINNRVGASMAVRQAVQGGNLAAVNKIFKDAVKEYVQRDKETAAVKDQTIVAQAAKKPLIPGAAIVQTGAVTDEQIKAAPKAQRSALLEQQMDEGLSALMSKSRR